MTGQPTVIADAVKAAAAEREAEQAQAAAHAAAEDERQADIASIKRGFKAKGMKGALAIGRSLGWDKDDIEAIFRIEPTRPAPPPPDEQPDGDEPPAVDGGDTAPPKWQLRKKPIKPLPPNCPVIPLGTQAGQFYYLNPLKEFIQLGVSDHNANGLRGLFIDRIQYLWDNWPKFSEPKSATDLPKHRGWKPDECTDTLFEACAQRGLFDPDNRLRGRGGWRDEEGRLVLHLGDKLLVEGELRPPGELGRHIYPAREACPHPSETPNPAAIQRLLSHFDGWAWSGRAGQREGLDHALGSILLLGWIAAGIAGGALSWRPMLWLTGGAGTGKSTLQGLVRDLLGDYLVDATDASGPSIWQALKHDCLPVALDEMEPDPANPKNANIIKLARAAASGGKIMRGSVGGQASFFQARSAFLFSSIIIPPMLGQDVSRFCILDLAPLGQRRLSPIPAADLRHTGQALLRALIDGWPRWQATLERYQQALIAVGHTQRGADLWGVLLAMADLMQGAEPFDNDTIAILAAMLLPEDGDAVRDELAMLNHLLSANLTVFRAGKLMTVGQLVARAAGLIHAAENDEANAAACAEQLRSWSIYVTGHGDQARVTLPNQSKSLLRLFEHSQWGGIAGAAGGWVQAMRRLPGVQPERSTKLGGRGWSIPAKVFLQHDDEG